jgi:hypothetical protein
VSSLLLLFSPPQAAKRAHATTLAISTKNADKRRKKVYDSVAIIILELAESIYSKGAEK